MLHLNRVSQKKVTTSTERMRKLRAKQPKKEKKPPMTSAERVRLHREKKKKLLENQQVIESSTTNHVQCDIMGVDQKPNGERNETI